MRIVAMLMIIILHLLGHGGLLSSVKIEENRLFTSHYAIVWLLEIICYCAVNCYALISGYVGWRSKFSFSKLAVFWFQVLFYSLAVLAVLSFFFDITSQMWLRAFTPIFSSVYWYATAHFGVMLLMPILNNYIQISEKKHSIVIIVSLLLFLAVLPAYLNVDPFHIRAGYSTLWLSLLYVLGGLISKNHLINLISKRYCLLAFFILTWITWNNKLLGFISFDLVKYTSPTIILSGVFLLLLFSQLKISKVIVIKIVTFLSSASFSVYLIHDNPVFRNYMIKNSTKSFLNESLFLLCGKIISLAIAIYLFSAIVDFFRQKMMSILKIDKVLLSLEGKLLK